MTLTASVIETVAAAPWKSFGMDTGDDTVGLKLLYVFARTVVGKNATNLFYAVRRELGAKGIELFNMFMDCLSGADLSWGYDLSIKLRQDVARELAEEQAMEQAFMEEDEEKEDVMEQVAPVDGEEHITQYVAICNKLEECGLSFGLDVEDCYESTSSVGSDAANNFWGTEEGFEGYRSRQEAEFAERHAHEKRTLRVHCVNHRQDLEQRGGLEDDESEIMEHVGDMVNILMQLRKYWASPANHTVCKNV